MLRDGAGVELQAEDGLAAIYRLPVTVVAFDQDVPAEGQSALSQRHCKVSGTVVQVVDGRSMHRNATLIHLHHRPKRVF